MTEIEQSDIFSQWAWGEDAKLTDISLLALNLIFNTCWRWNNLVDTVALNSKK